MWAQSTAIGAAIKANPSRGGGAKLRISLEEVAGLPNSGEGLTMLRPTKHERERRLSPIVSPFTEGLTFTRVLQVKSTISARRCSELRCARPHVWGYGGRGARAVPSVPKSWSRRGSNLTAYMEKVEDMISFPVLRACANRDRVRV
jgi:hypothetical protein